MARRLVFTWHAEDMLRERNLKREWIERAIDAPDSTEDDPKRPGTIRAFVRVTEQDDRVLRVVYVPEGSTARVLTAFFDRTRKR